MRHNTGQLDQRVEFYKRDSVPDGIGGFTYTDTLFQTLWCEVLSVGGGESEEFKKVAEKARCIFVIRYNPDIKEDMSIKYLGDKFNISFIKKLGGRKMFTEIEAERGVTL